MKHAILTVVAAALVTVTASHATAQVTDEQVNVGIARLKRAIYKLQQPDGSFETNPGRNAGPGDRNLGGDTGLAVYALITAGESFQDPRLAKAIKWLGEQQITGTYALGIRCHVWSHLPDQFIDKLRQDVYTLDQWKAPPAGAVGGAIAWSYGDKVGPVHTSPGQYGVLGFWEGAKRGLPIGSGDWKAIEAYYTTSQNPDGGWGYRYKGESRLSMACAGLTCLYITQDYAHRDDYKQPGAARKHPLTRQLDLGLEYMNKSFPGGGAGALYALYGCERVGLASGQKYFNNQDWYAWGAAQILKTMGDREGPYNLDSHGFKAAGHGFALLFLARGGVPVMVNKLEVPDYDWNNRPRDLANLTAWVSDTVEQEINWQVVSINLHPERWMDAPLLYLASHEPLKLTDEQAARIKTYIDSGGLLVTVADQSSPSFSRSVEELMAKLYPSLKYEPLESDDDLANTVFTVNPTRVGVTTLSNGARHLAIHIPRGDVSWAFHARQHADPTPWELFVNAYHYATSKRGARPRLAEHVLHRVKGKGDSAPQITVGRATYDGNHDPEPLAWPTQSDLMYNAARARLDTEPVGLDDLSKTQARLVHVAGTDAVEFTDAQTESVKRYVDAGGVVLFENVGGRGEFTRSVMAMLRKAYPSQRLRPISVESPIVTGAGIGGEDARRVRYRLFSQLRMGDVDTPRLLTINFGDEPRIIVSGEDLSLGILGAEHWGVFGYDTDSARRLMGNIMLWANSPRQAPAVGQTADPAPMPAAAE